MTESESQADKWKVVKRLAKPLLDIHCKREAECDYPTEVWIAMDDGTVQKYTLMNKPNLCFEKAWDSLQISIGYQCNYRPKRKDRIHRSKR